MSKSVLDASAVLALLQAEPGSEIVAKHLPDAVVSTVNLSEVVAKLAEAGMPKQAIRAALSTLGFSVEPFDEDAAYAAGILRLETRALGLSLGDRACLVLGRKLSLPVVTTERAWSRLRLDVQVVVAR